MQIAIADSTGSVKFISFPLGSCCYCCCQSKKTQFSHVLNQRLSIGLSKGISHLVKRGNFLLAIPQGGGLSSSTSQIIALSYDEEENQAKVAWNSDVSSEESSSSFKQGSVVGIVDVGKEGILLAFSHSSWLDLLVLQEDGANVKLHSKIFDLGAIPLFINGYFGMQADESREQLFFATASSKKELEIYKISLPLSFCDGESAEISLNVQRVFKSKSTKTKLGNLLPPSYCGCATSACFRPEANPKFWTCNARGEISRFGLEGAGGGKPECTFTLPRRQSKRIWTLSSHFEEEESQLLTVADAEGGLYLLESCHEGEIRMIQRIPLQLNGAVLQVESAKCTACQTDLVVALGADGYLCVARRSHQSEEAEAKKGKFEFVGKVAVPRATCFVVMQEPREAMKEEDLLWDSLEQQ